MNWLTADRRQAWRRELPFWVAMYGGWLLSEIDGDNYAALRFAGLFAVYVCAAWILWQDGKRAVAWLQSHSLLHIAAKAALWAPYYLGLFWIWWGPEGGWPLRLRLALTFALIVLWAVVAAVATVAVSFVREMRRSGS